MKPRIFLAIALSAIVSHMYFLKDRIKHLFGKVDIESCEVFVTATTLWIGWRISFPAHLTLHSTFVKQISSHIPGNLPPHVWGPFAFAVGLMMMFSLLENIIVLRRIAVMLAAMFWYFTGVVLLISNSDYYTPGLHICIAVACSFLFIRLGIQLVDLSIAEKRTKSLSKEISKVRFLFREVIAP